MAITDNIWPKITSPCPLPLQLPVFLKGTEPKDLGTDGCHLGVQAGDTVCELGPESWGQMADVKIDFKCRSFRRHLLNARLTRDKDLILALCVMRAPNDT